MWFSSFMRRASRLQEKRAGGAAEFSGAKKSEARVGIGLRATLKIRKLLVLLNEKKAKNREFAAVRYTAGTRIAI
jgi:hypothetical protein